MSWIDCEMERANQEKQWQSVIVNRKEYLQALEALKAAREALIECDRQTESMRIWGGMEYKYSPPHAKKIHEAARNALDQLDALGK